MRNKLRRPLAFLLSAVMIVTMSGTPVHAVADRGQPETGLCEHHAAHTDDCGYTEETPGTPCGHEHIEDCYIEVTECVHEHTPECYPEETEDSVSGNEATPANAKEREPENCPHICDGESGCITEKLDCRHEHDSECGYTESTPGTPCTFVCEICNPQDSGEAGKEPETGIIKQEQCSCLTLCTEGQINPDCPVCGGLGAGLSDCKGEAEEENADQPEDTGICKHHQEHDADCGYIPKSEDGEGSPCTYECRICPVEDLIADLPDKVTEDNAEEVRAQLEEILALYGELNEDEQEQIDLSRCYALQEALDNANAPMQADGRAEQQNTDEASVTIGTETLYYATLEEAFDAANGKTATITMLNDAECVHSGSAGSPLNINGGNVTLNLNGNTLSGNGYRNYGIINVSGGSLLVEGKGSISVALVGLSCRESGKLTVEGITLELVGSDIFAASAGVDNEGGTVILNGTQMTGAASEGQIYHYSGTTTINSVTATEATESNPGSVYYQGDSGTLTINGGTFGKITVSSYNNGGVQSVAGLLGEGCAYKKQGGTWATDDELAGLEISNVTVEKIPLTIHPQGDTSWYYSTQQTHTLAMNAAPVDSSDSVTYVWKSGTETLDCTSDTYTVPAGTPVGSYTYTCEATCDGYTLSHTFTFKIEKSGTEFTGGIKTYNGSKETTGFAADDTITVKAAPTATGTAPQKAAARLRADPTAGQMALFVGDVQVSEPVEAGADGTYIMTISAVEVLLKGNAEPNGNAITLTAKFVGNGNMADAAGTVDVRISAVAMAEKDGTVIGYYGESNLASAFTNEGVTITLLDNITTSTLIWVNTDNLTLDLNGKTYTCTDNAFLVSLGSLTVKGSGEVTSTFTYCLAVNGGTLNIENGSFYAERSAVYVSSGTLALTGGSFTGDQNAIAYASGDVTAALANYGGADAPHYAFYQGSSPYAPSGSSLPSGTFTVQECQHTGVEVTNLGDGKHGLTCPYCGYHYEHTTTLTATASGNNVTLNGGCGTEGCGYQTTLGTASFTFPKVTYGQSGDVTCTWDGPMGYYGLIEVIGGSQWQFNKNEDENIVEISRTLAQLFGSTKVTAGEHKLKVSFFSDVQSNECELPFTVAKAPLTPSITGTAAKTYDGTTACDGTGLSIALDGVVDGDTVTATASYAYGNANAGENKTITASGITLEGDDKTNYTLSSTTATTTGTITKSQPTIAFVSGYNPGKTYDGQTIPNPTADNLTISGANFSDVTFEWSATPKDAGTYTLTAKIAETNNTEAASTTLSVTISRKAVTPTVTITPDSYEYTGQQIKPGEDANTTVTVKDGGTVISASEYTLSYGENTHVGSGTVKVTDSGSGNYQITEKTQNFTITKKHQETLSISGKPETTVYGDTFALATDGGSGEGAVTWSVTGPASVSATGEVKITGVGSVTVTANKAGGDDYENAEATLTFEAAKKPVTAVVTAANKTYDGNTSATVAAEVTTGLLTGDSITISGVTGTFDNANAGTGKTVTVVSTGASFSGTNADKYQVTFPASTTADIEKANASIATAPAGKTGLTYTGAAQALVTAGTASVGEVVYSLTETGTYSTTIPTGTNAGSYTVWYKIADTNNYNGTAPVKVDVTIAKVNYTGEKAGSTSGKFGVTKTYNLTDLLPEGYVLGTITITDTSSIFESTPTVSGTTLTYKLADSAEVGKTGTITIPVTESTNYNSFDLTITVTVTNVRIPNLTVNPISVTYTGSPVSSDKITGTATVDGVEVTGTWSFVSGQNLTNVADSGVKSVVFNPTNTSEYGPATGTVTVTIRKATPGLTLTPSPATLPNGGTVTLTLSGLPSGGAATVTCSDENITVTKGSGSTWTADLPAGGASYTFTASYAGDGNHNGASANCTVSVEKITPTLSLTANPASLRGGGTVTLTLSGLPAGGTATVTCDRGITITAGAGNTWTATLPNSTAIYTFTASYAGSASYNAASASCSVETTEVTVLPDAPAGDNGESLRLVMEDGISEVPAGLQSIETLNTPEKLETAMKTAITQANSGVPQANTAVYDVELQISTDGGATWTTATKENFPSTGLTITLPYPEGTNSSYKFTVVHMFTTSGDGYNPGDMETPTVTNTAQGIHFTVTGLSPISVGWEHPSTPSDPSGPSTSYPTGGGGGNSVSTYAVTVEKSEHGKVTSNRTNASSGSTVTLTVTPDSGYVLDTLTVTDGRGSEIRLTAQGDGRYTFTMPSRAVTVKATFALLPDDRSKPCDGGADCPSHGFTDLGTVGTWYHEAVDYVLRNGLMNGYSGTLFGPNDNLSRAQFAQILFNKEGRPVVNYLLQYGDVAGGAWYTEAVRWATSQGIVGGYGNGMFGPNDNITREQLAVMLWRYAGSPAATDKELHFTDADEASGYALEALRWAAENGVLNGYGDGRLNPKGLATRAQVAQMLKNFLENQ